MIVRTEAIVLKSMRYGESSRIATLFTREKGKLSVIAKGARRTRSRFGSALLPMSYTEVVVYCKPNRSLQTLSETTHLLRFPSLARDLRKISAGLRMMELVAAVTHEEERNPGLFNLTLQALQRLSISTSQTENIVPFFELRLAAELGFAPLIDRTRVADIGESGGFLALDQGSVSSDRDGAHPVHGTRRALRAFAILAKANIEDALRMQLDGGTRREVEELIHSFMLYHLEESYPTRSKRVIGQIAL